jgi:hypothetical protein
VDQRGLDLLDLIRLLDLENAHAFRVVPHLIADLGVNRRGTT